VSIPTVFSTKSAADLTMTESALALVECGFEVFPTHGVYTSTDGLVACTCPRGTDCRSKGKHPVPARGFLEATTDPAQVRRWWRADRVRGEGGWNVALRTTSRFVVLDADVKSDGLDTIEQFEAWSNGLSLPETVRVRTGSGGLHLLYRTAGTARVVSRNRILPGLDIKADGGYVVTVPSLHESGGLYRFENPDHPLAELPPDVTAWLLTQRGHSAGGGGSSGHDYDPEAGGRAGQRDEHINRRAFELRKAGLAYDDAVRVMRDEWLKLEQPEGDEFTWETVLYKIKRVWDSVDVDEDLARFLRIDWRPTITNVPIAGDVLQEGPPQLEAPPAWDPLPTELGNAMRFSRLHAGVVKYCHDEGRWYVWDGRRFRADELNSVQTMLRRVISDIRTTAVATADDAGRRTWTTWARASESLGNQNATLKLASSLPEVAVVSRQLDANPWLLGVENGVIDLKTGRLRPAQPADLITRQAAVAYDPEARCDRWRDHVKLVTDGDVHLAAYLRRAAGYALTGLTTEQKFFFLYGSGQNGKNAFVETLLGILGDYGAQAQEGLLTGGEHDHPTALASLRGMRLVMVDETGVGRRFNDARLKGLTGSAKIRARYMRQDFFEFDSTMKLWVLGNHKPRVADQSAGMWRRMQLVPFTVAIPEDRRILDYTRILLEERAGILNWCLEGLADWLRAGGLGLPEAVNIATQAYRQEEDEFGQWWSECVDETGAEDDETSVGALYISYTTWCALAGIRRDVLNRTHFGRELTSRGFGSRLVSRGGAKMRVIEGVRLGNSTG
jgi:putative DNA primase/helicase